jgi:predicted dehydrogenase
MNELQYFSHEDDTSVQGFRTILATEPTHPYMKSWWPPGHIIGYEHTFVHAVVDFLRAIDQGTRIEPDFRDGIRILKVLEAGLQSAESGQRVQIS